MNYFTIAKRERDQDNFFEWLLRSYDSKNEAEKAASLSLFKLLIPDFDCDEKIVNVCVRQQMKFKGAGIPDLLLFVDIGKKKYLICIEDKVDAAIKNNLSAYKKYIEENYAKILKKLRVICVDVELKFFVIKTGLYLSGSDSGKIEKSGFELLGRDQIAKCLEMNNKGSELIEMFLASLNYSEDTPLTEFSRRKEHLVNYLGDKTHRATVFDEEKEKYHITLDCSNSSCLELNNFSLSSPELKFRLFGRGPFTNDGTCFSRVFKNSTIECLACGSKTMKEKSLGELTKALKEIIDDAERGLKEN